MKNRISKGIVIFSILILLRSIWDLNIYISFSHYRSLFYFLPEKVLLIRYVFSVALRIALFVSGAGILFRRDIFRKILLFISFFTIATIYWKHPVACFRNIVMSLIAQGAFPADLIPMSDTIIWALVAVNYAIDIGFSLCLIYYFTRPKVREQFS
jgi:hypothetical protein